MNEMTMATRVIINLLAAVDAFVAFFTLGKVQTGFKSKFLQSKLDQLIQKELEAANKVIDHLNQK